MSDAIEAAVTVTIAVIGIIGGAFGRKALDRWFERDRRRNEQGKSDTARAHADNEEARAWLRKRLESVETELKQFRQREIDLMAQLAIQSSEVARLGERSATQAHQIEALQDTVAHLERDNERLRAKMGEKV